ncbi:hypothetical protein J31TS4_12310 [Paenibacillus sp. J31TS4]|uniref:AAA family ATPase n=1 Tax=Paenibacillus sp. J31TS4 TaxID=2807195 RepID=UPI001B29FB98|nr:AAA family ATPase [Paenibacillus sp. J31TS4]GIP37951.1 hypothetical protein J31TS4_12310 [Paenibacillus sp. J31TS4]
MRIEEIRIDGFGIHAGRTLAPAAGLTVLYGANEAGKSTLMAFVRAVLFGFPSRAQTESRYEPEKGGLHGGSLLIRTSDGSRVRIERTDDGRGPSGGRLAVTREDGSRAGEEELVRLLGGMSGELFRSLFAFSLTELQEIRTLQADELSGYLYGAGFGAQARLIAEAERRAAQEADALYKPRGKNQEMARRLRELEQAEAELRRSKEQAGRYNRIAAERRETEAEIARLDERLRQARREAALLSGALQAREAWLQRRTIRDELESLAPASAVPYGAAERLERLLEARRHENAAAARLKSRLEQLDEELDRLRPELGTPEDREELAALTEELPGYRAGRRALAELDAELGQLRRRIDAELRRIGPAWTDAVLDRQPVTVARKEELRGRRERLDLAVRTVQQAEAELALLRQAEAEARERLGQRESECDAFAAAFRLRFGEPDSPAPASLHAEALAGLRRGLRQLEQLEVERRHAERREQDHLLQLDRDAAAAPPAAASAGALGPLAWLSACLAVAVPALLAAAGRPWLALGGLVATGAFSAYAFALRHRLAPVPPTLARARPASEGLAALRGERERLERHEAALADDLRARLGSALAAAPEAAAAGAGHPPLAEMALRADAGGADRSAAALGTEAAELLVQLERWAGERHEAERELSRRREAAAEADAEALRRAARLREGEERLRRAQEAAAEDRSAWERWLAAGELPAGLSPETAAELLALAEQTAQRLQDGRELQRRREGERDRLRRFEAAAERLLGEAAGREPERALADWRERQTHAERQLAERERLLAERAETEQAARAAEAERTATERELEALWASADAPDEAAFRERLRAHERREELQRMLRELDDRLALAFAAAGETERERCEQRLAAAAPEELEAELDALRRTVEESEREADRLRDVRGRLGHELDKLEDGAEHADRLFRLEEQRAELKELIGRWATLALCSRLFKETRERYEKERQPGVLRRASVYFERMTDGRYRSVSAPLGEKRLQAERASDGRWLDSSRLSRGTAEQLYLAMRFALAEEYARKAPLPLIMDDILVNFDALRMRRTMAMLGELASRHQILLFTCHAHMAEAARELVPDSRVLTL